MLHRFSLSTSRDGLLALASGLLVACSSAAPAPATPPPAPAPTVAEVAAPAPAPANTPPAPSKAGPEGAMCGGLAGFGCATGLYCAFPVEAHCGAADQAGTCRALPEVCTEELAPVCGCNDKTYPNACHAAREGISVGATGACAAPPALAEGQTCGTRGVNGECGPDLYCAFKADCGQADQGGACTKKPKMCTKIYAPVCGCDAKTHGSACSAAAAGVSVAAKGECKAK